MGWIWFKGIKTRKPAKTASLMLDTAAAEQSFVGRGPLKGGCGERPVSISFRVTLWGLLEPGQDRLHLLPLPGSFGTPALAWGFSVGQPGSQLQQVPPVASGAVPPSCTPTFAWCLGRPGLAQRVPQTHNPGDVRNFSRTHLEAQKGEGGGPECLPA